MKDLRSRNRHKLAYKLNFVLNLSQFVGCHSIFGEARASWIYPKLLVGFRYVQEIETFPKRTSINWRNFQAELGVEFSPALEIPIGILQSFTGTAGCWLQIWRLKTGDKRKLISFTGQGIAVWSVCAMTLAFLVCPMQITNLGGCVPYLTGPS